MIFIPSIVSSASYSNVITSRLLHPNSLPAFSNDAIALASMQATACAVDVVAKYADPGVSFPADGTDIFAGIESCEANLFDDTSSFDGIGSVASGGPALDYFPPASSGGGSGTPSDDGETVPPVVKPSIDSSKPTMTVSRGNEFICNSIEYKVTLSNVIYDSSKSKADFTVISNTPSSDTETIIKGTGYWSVGDLRIRLNFVSSTSSVSGKLKCNGYAVDYSGTTGTFGFTNSWVG